jgi:hypothetical protein
MKNLILLAILGVTLSQASTVQLVSAGNGRGLNDGSYYVGNVVLNIDGTPTNAVCIDFYDHTSIGEIWSGSLIPMPGAETNYIVQDFYFPGVTAQMFSEAVFLYGAMQQNNSNDTLVIDIQHALWNLFSNGHTGLADGGWGHTASTHGTLTNQNGYAIVVSQSNGNCPQPQEQAFLLQTSSVPEPGVAFLLGGGLIFIGAFARRGRKL